MTAQGGQGDAGSPLMCATLTVARVSPIAARPARRGAGNPRPGGRSCRPVRCDGRVRRYRRTARRDGPPHRAGWRGRFRRARRGQWCLWGRRRPGRGYEVLLYSARGFGRTGGAIGLASPDYDVADARQLLDWLAGRPEVLRDGPGDPRVAFFGVSYGGGIALLTAALDRRVDVVVPVATWNSLVSAFDPGGVLKQQWAAAFFGTPPGAAGVCPPFVPPVCPAYLDTAAAGAP